LFYALKACTCISVPNEIMPYIESQSKFKYLKLAKNTVDHLTISSFMEFEVGLNMREERFHLTELQKCFTIKKWELPIEFCAPSPSIWLAAR